MRSLPRRQSCGRESIKMDAVTRDESYRLQSGNRVFQENDRRAKHKMSISLTMPLMMRQEYWNRYELSKQDVHHILSAYPDRIRYQLAIFLDIKVPMSAIKMEYGEDRHMTFYTRYKVVDHILSAIEEKGYKFSETSKLWHGTDTHQPCLPAVWCSEEELGRLQEIMPEWWDPLSLTSFRDAQTYRDTLLVPVEKVDGFICMHRVLPEDGYTDFGQSFTSRAPRCLVRGERYVITEEACWFAVQPPLSQGSDA